MTIEYRKRSEVTDEMVRLHEGVWMRRWAFGFEVTSGIGNCADDIDVAPMTKYGQPVSWSDITPQPEPEEVRDGKWAWARLMEGRTVQGPDGITWRYVGQAIAGVSPDGKLVCEYLRGFWESGEGWEVVDD